MSGIQTGFANELPLVSLLAPAADAAGRTGRWVNTRWCVKCKVKAEINQGNAAQVTLSLLQAKDSAGTGSKAIQAVVPINLQADTSVSDVPVAQAKGTTFLCDATLKNKIVEFEFLPVDVLDIPNGFKFITISTSGSNAANITQAEMQYVAMYKQAFPPSIYL